MNGRDVSIVIGSYDRSEFLRAAIDSVRRETNGLAAEIIVVDGGSNDGSIGWLVRQRDLITVVQHNRGTWRGEPIQRRSWGYFMNLGFKLAQGRYICMLSDDCLVVPGAISSGLDEADSLRAAGRKLGALAFFWRNWPEERAYRVGRTFGGKLFVNHGLYLRKALEHVGYADEDNYAFYHADGDLCLRMWEAGYECLPASNSFVEHYALANAPARESNQSLQRMDWERYSGRWSHLDVERDRNDRSDWIYREYFDPTETACQFDRIRAVRVQKLRALLRRGARAVKGVVKERLAR